MIGDPRPREDQLKTQVGPFNPQDLDEDGGFNPSKYIARIRKKHNDYRDIFWRPEWQNKRS